MLNGIERRRRWPDETKIAIVAEALGPGVVISDVARQFRDHAIGEDSSERLDKIPVKYRAPRPKYACRTCERTGADDVAGVIQAPAPARLVEGGLPTEALVADVIVSKYAWHCLSTGRRR